jgi:cellulose biosynthesis protein BcsQ
VALFNHKGGVSKTTTTFHLGWMLAEMGHRVVMVDTDPQCNLTGLVLGFDQTASLDEFYEQHPDQNIWSALKPAFESQPRVIEPVACAAVANRDGLLLLPGHVNLSEYEITLGIAQELSGSLHALRNLPGAFHDLITKVAEANQADYVLIDMNPSLGAINQNLLMTSNSFIVPMAPDYFSMMAISSLSIILPKWISWARNAATTEILTTAAYPFPEPTLKFLGSVIQKYRPRGGKATEGFQKWIDAINQRVTNQLFPTLRDCALTFPEETYAASGVTATESYCLAQIPDFNTLIAASQTNQTPVFALTDDMLGHSGVVLEIDQQKRAEFEVLFRELATRVVSLTQHV